MRKNKTLLIIAAVSIMLHAAVMYVASNNFQKLLDSLKEVEEQVEVAFNTEDMDIQQQSILQDFKEFKENEEVERNTPLVSSKNIKQTGKVTEEKGMQKISREMQSLTPVPNPSPEKQQEEVPEKVERIEDLELEDSPMAEVTVSTNLEEQEKKEKKEFVPDTAVNTENSTVLKMNLDNEREKIQVGSREFEHATFYLNYSKSLLNKFRVFIEQDAYRNIRMIAGDRVQMLTRIDRNGNISFVQMVHESPTQPLFNYWAQKSAEYAADLPEVPASLFPIDQQYIYLPISYEYTGPPTYTYWIGIGRPMAGY